MLFFSQKIYELQGGQRDVCEAQKRIPLIFVWEQQQQLCSVNTLHER